MDFLVIGGTRFFGIPMIEALLQQGHKVTIATRGLTADPFGNVIERIRFDHSSAESCQNAFSGKSFDVVIDKISYCANDVKRVLDSVKCRRFILMSSTAVYAPLHPNTKETEFVPLCEPLHWGERQDMDYGCGKRQAEAALAQLFASNNWAAVRYPFVIGELDYTKRLAFYVQSVINGAAMHIDNLDQPLGFIHAADAGHFLAHLAASDFCGTINGCNNGTISLQEILSYIEQKIHKKALLSPCGLAAPYNGAMAYSINTELAQQTGFTFADLQPRMFQLIDYYIEQYS